MYIYKRNKLISYIICIAILVLYILNITVCSYSSDTSNTGTLRIECKTHYYNLGCVRAVPTVDKEYALPGDSLTYTISIINYNEALEVNNVVIEDTISSSVDFISAYTSRGENLDNVSVDGVLKYTIDNMSPMEEISITINAVVKNDVTEGSVIENSSRVASSHGEGYNASLPAETTITNVQDDVVGEDTPQPGISSYPILVTFRGSGSSGSFEYSGSKSGTLKSGDVVSLLSNEYIEITGLPAGVKYSVVELYSRYNKLALSRDTDGTIEANNISTAVIVNDYSDLPTGEELPSTGGSYWTWLALFTLSVLCFILGGLISSKDSNVKSKGD